jgi:hypothetical protein
MVCKYAKTGNSVAVFDTNAELATQNLVFESLIFKASLSFLKRASRLQNEPLVFKTSLSFTKRASRF